MTTISKEISTRFKGLLGLNFPPILGPLLVLIVLILGISIIKPRFVSSQFGQPGPAELDPASPGDR